jgi:predicted nucleic acid-binding protein
VIQLADTSAWVWSRRSGIAGMREAFDVALVDGFVATCDVVQLELLSGARSREAFDEIREGLEALPSCPLGKAEWGRSLWVYEQLAAQGGVRHRSVGQATALVAAAAESAGLTVLHYNAAFERIASVTGQPVRRLAPPPVSS